MKTFQFPFVCSLLSILTAIPLLGHAQAGALWNEGIGAVEFIKTHLEDRFNFPEVNVVRQETMQLTRRTPRNQLSQISAFEFETDGNQQFGIARVDIADDGTITDGTIFSLTGESVRFQDGRSVIMDFIDFFYPFSISPDANQVGFIAQDIFENGFFGVVAIKEGSEVSTTAFCAADTGLGARQVMMGDKVTCLHSEGVFAERVDRLYTYERDPTGAPDGDGQILMSTQDTVINDAGNSDVEIEVGRILSAHQISPTDVFTYNRGPQGASYARINTDTGEIKGAQTFDNGNGNTGKVTDETLLYSYSSEFEASDQQKYFRIIGQFDYNGPDFPVPETAMGIATCNEEMVCSVARVVDELDASLKPFTSFESRPHVSSVTALLQASTDDANLKAFGISDLTEEGLPAPRIFGDIQATDTGLLGSGPIFARTNEDIEFSAEFPSDGDVTDSGDFGVLLLNTTLQTNPPEFIPGRTGFLVIEDAATPNSPPELESLSDKILFASKALSIDVLATDEDGDFIELNVVNLPQFCDFTQIDSGIGTINCGENTEKEQLGERTVTVTATDSIDIDTENFILKIVSIEVLPVPPQPLQVAENSQIAFPAPVDILPVGLLTPTVALNGAPFCVVNDPEEDGGAAEIRCAPLAGDNGTFEFVITIDFDSDNSILIPFDLLVVPENLPPVADFVDTCDGLICSFTNTSTDDKGLENLAFQWFFPDDGFAVEPWSLATDTGFHFGYSGVRQVVLKATDEEGVSDEKIAEINVLNGPPIADFIAVCDGLNCEFSNASIDDGGVTQVISWFIGNTVITFNGILIEQIFHNFPSAGMYPVDICVQDLEGAEDCKGYSLVAVEEFPISPEWPWPYNGTAPDSSLGLDINNIGIYDSNTGIIHTCVAVMNNGQPDSLDGVEKFDINFTVLSVEKGQIRVQSARLFNESGIRNGDGEPDCSGTFDLATLIYKDTIAAEDTTYTVEGILTDDITLDIQITLAEALAKGKQINGIVRGEDGEPLVGVHILVEGFNTGTLTDSEGNFVLGLPPLATSIQVQYTGYEEQLVEVGGDQSFFEIKLDVAAGP